MSSVPVHATNAQPHETSRPGDAGVVRGVAAFLVLLALAAVLLVPGTDGIVVAASIAALAFGLFWAAKWRRAAA